ncbi:MAG: HAD family phosphatase [Nakamurella sp.]
MTDAAGGDRPAVPGDQLAAVLFDMDGTLIDSEPLWGVAMDRVAGRLGGTLSAGAVEATTGLSIPASVELLLADIGSDLDPVSTESLLLEVTGELFAEELRWQPGAEELIDEIRAAGLQTALVTNSPRSVVQVALDLLGGHRFDVTIAGDEVAAGKPDPEPYLSAIRGLGLESANCLAVEDSPSGTESAVAAGIAVLVVSAGVAVPEGPGRIFASSLLGATVEELRHIHHEFRRSRHRLDAS